MSSAEERFQKLLESIDVGVRAKRLQAEQTSLLSRFDEAYANLLSQQRFVARHEKELADLGEKPDPVAKAIREAALAEVKEVERRQAIVVEHFASEIALVAEQLDEIKQAGLPKRTDADP